MNLIKKLSGACVLAAALGAMGSVSAAEYVIDGTDAGMHTSVNFRASHVGISALWGRFNDISGSFSYDAANIAASTITVKIDPASIDTNQAARDEHLRTADYLDVAKFPEAGFVSTMIHDMGEGKLHLTGNFTLHGVTKEISFEALRTGEGETPFGDYRVGFEAELTLDVAEYGIALGPDPKLTLILAIEGVRQ
jgi:polyisoprenoid-binding protein YceI